jgi:large subunit ribosomal protein L10
MPCHFSHYQEVTTLALNLEQKKAIVAEVKDVASSAYSAVAAEYRGLTVEEMTQLRREARNNGVYLRVVKNTLARRAVEDTDFACMQEGLTGPLVLAFSQQDPGAAARVIKDFAKEHKRLEVKLISIGGRMLAPSELETLAKMPTYDQAIYADGGHEGSGGEACTHHERGARQAGPDFGRGQRRQRGGLNRLIQSFVLSC